MKRRWILASDSHEFTQSCKFLGQADIAHLAANFGASNLLRVVNQVLANNIFRLRNGRLKVDSGDGQLQRDGKRTYTWDAAKRLISVKDKTTSQKSEFAYDGQSRMTVRKEYANATATPSETRYLWCGDKVCEARDGQDNITGRYYDEGEVQGSTSLYYVKDHLGSITDVVSAQGKSLGKLDYGPYGEQEKATGKLTDFRYAGMLYHPNTGYYFTHYRVYDPETGRWLSRDPIGEEGGINLYGYVRGNPMSRTDPLGLASVEEWIKEWVCSSSSWQQALAKASTEKMLPGSDADNRTAAEHYIFVRDVVSQGGVEAAFFKFFGSLSGPYWQGQKWLGFRPTSSPPSWNQFLWEERAWWDQFDDNFNKYIDVSPGKCGCEK